MTVAKDAAGDSKKRELNPMIIYGIPAAVALVLLGILIVWLALRPSDPRFYLQNTSVYQLNLTAGTGLLTALVQVTLSSHNPNSRAGTYYDRLDAAVFYKGQQITAPTALPPGFLGRKGVVVWSPFLYGTAVPTGPYLYASLEQDAAAGLVALDVRVDGSLRWKIGAWTSGHRHMHVDCSVLVCVDRGNSGNYGESPPLFRFQQTTECSVDV